MKSRISLLRSALAHHVEGRNNEAAARYAAALHDDPDDAVALSNLSSVAFLRHNHHAALAYARRAMEISPSAIGPRINLARVLAAMGHQEDAITILKRICEQDSGVSAVWQLLAQYRWAAGEFALAAECIENASVIEETREIRVSRAHQQMLSRGRYAEGLRYIDDIRSIPLWARHPIIDSGVPLWSGEDLTGKRIALLHEQGAGDTIMLSRFFAALGEFDFIVPHYLMRFLGRIPGASMWGWDADGIPDVDYWTTTFYAWRDMGAPHPSGTPYLASAQSLSPPLRLRLPNDKFKIGICWSGYSGYGFDFRRSAALTDLLPIAAIPGTVLVSLQMDGREEIEAAGAQDFIRDPMVGVRDYEDTSRIISELDLVISVDTSVAHVAGAIGVPCFVMLDYTPCWRWGIGSETTHWYDAVRLFRKPHPGGWGAVVGEIETAIRAKIA